jgi:hypothetical protein
MRRIAATLAVIGLILTGITACKTGEHLLYPDSTTQGQ